MAGCRKIIGLDGYFLKGNFGGQLLSTVALDANDCIYPVAYAIGERHLGRDIEIVNRNQWTFMSDKQKALLEKQVLPTEESVGKVQKSFRKGYF